MNIVGHSLGVAAFRLAPKTQDPLSMIEFAYLEYTRKHRKSIRFPMETGYGSESGEQTFRRAIKEEIEGSKELKYRILEPMIYKETIPDDKLERGRHLKVFSLIQITSGLVRSRPILDGEATLGPILFASFPDLMEMMDDRGVRGHKCALLLSTGFLLREYGISEAWKSKVAPLHREWVQKYQNRCLRVDGSAEDLENYRKYLGF